MRSLSKRVHAQYDLYRAKEKLIKKLMSTTLKEEEEKI